MPKKINSTLVLAVVAAIIALAAGWLLPLPRLVLGDEEKAATRIPQDRSDVEVAKSNFDQAESSYNQYVQAHNVGGDLDSLVSAVHQAQANPSDQGASAAVSVASAGVLEYLAKLHSYAVAGEAYFSGLSHYDDELMAWTRSLGTESEALRPDTWPIVEYLKLYPPPTGETNSYASIQAAQVESSTQLLQQHIALLSRSPADSSTFSALNQDVQSVRDAGRSIEYVESLHANYDHLLSAYDAKVQVVAAGTNNDGLSPGRVALAAVLDGVLGLVIVLGLASLFAPSRRLKREVVE